MTCLSTFSLSEFLTTSKSEYLSAIASNTAREWTVVMGNEAGDLDSIASAIAFAWIQSSTHPDQKTIALLQTHREDLRLRAENLHALSLSGLDERLPELLCLDDLPEWSSVSFPSEKFALVDHNRIVPIYTRENPNARVTSIIDHHVDEGLYPDSIPRKIMPAGSCASLVAHYHSPNPFPSQIATLLLAAILIDTDGLKPTGKALEVDHAAAMYLAPHSSLFKHPDEPIVGPGQTLFHLAAIRELTGELGRRKTDLSDASTWDLLRRDYKQYTLLLPSSSGATTIEAGLASVPLALKSWITRDSFATDVVRWMDRRGLTVFGILTSFRHETKFGKDGRGKHRREQMWVVKQTAGVDLDALEEKLWTGLDGASEHLGLERIDQWVVLYVGSHQAVNALHALGARARVFKQKQVDATRKVTAPLMKEILERPVAGEDVN